MGRLILGLFAALVAAGMIAASGLFGGGDGNAISNGANCAYSMNGANVLDIVRECGGQVIGSK